MRILGKLIDKLEPQDILYLKDNQVQEDVSLEYKEKVPGNSDSDKKEFLADVSAFANMTGGTIVFGIEEERDLHGQTMGIPANIVGIDNANVDKVTQRLEAIIRNGLDPKLSNVKFRDIDVDGKTVFLIGIPRSLFAPHVVWFKKYGRFYIRTNTGKAQMDVHELRRVFLQTDDWGKAADNFRRQRIMDMEYQTPIPNLDAELCYFIHILPLGSSRDAIDLQVAFQKLRNLPWNPYDSWDSSYNIDGIMLTLGRQKVRAYIQCFRNGGVEFYISTPRERVSVGKKEIWALPGRTIEDYGVRYLTRYLAFSQELQVEPPLVVFLSLTNVKDCYICANPEWLRHIDVRYRRFDRDEILLPGAVIDNVDSEAEDVLAPVFDMLWQGAGWNESPFQAERRKRDKNSAE